MRRMLGHAETLLILL